MNMENMRYETVIGLEMHAELCTKSKMFCACENRYGAPTNTLCCPVCAGLPGALPVMNRTAVEYAAKLGLALGCQVHTHSQMARKNYFYPDLPKGYQISQAAAPLCTGGQLRYRYKGIVKNLDLVQIHIEEDAGKLVHSGHGGGTAVDLNRSGVPLVEVVTAPGLRSAGQAKAAMEALAQLLVYLGISKVQMQQGNLRADVNVSVRPVGQQSYGPRVEMKNVNSFRAVHRAIEYEAGRQMDILRKGGRIQQETRRWDDAKTASIPLRSKETQQDYRYFPEPDIPPLYIPQAMLDSIAEGLPEMPLDKMLRFMEEYKLNAYDAEQLAAKKERADFWEQVVRCGASPKEATNWTLGELLRLQNQNGEACGKADAMGVSPQAFAGLIQMVEEKEISIAAGKTVLETMLSSGCSARQAVAEKGLLQVSDEAELQAVVKKALLQNQQAVADYLAGKQRALGFLLGQSMKQSGGRGNPERLRALLLQTLATSKERE